MLTLKVTEEEITQLRQIDHAARRYVEALEQRVGSKPLSSVKREYEALLKALFDPGASHDGS